MRNFLRFLFTWAFVCATSSLFGQIVDLPDQTEWDGSTGNYASSHRERYEGSEMQAGNVMTQTVSGLTPGSSYAVTIYATASWTSGRGFTCNTGNDISVVFANDAETPLEVIERTTVSADDYGPYTVVGTVGQDGNLTYGIKNKNAGGNWFVAYAASIIKTGDYYIQNVESGLYLCGANNWGTQASVSVQGDLFELAAAQPNGQGCILVNKDLDNNGNNTLGYNLFTDTDTNQNGNVWVIAPTNLAAGQFSIHGKGKKGNAADAFDGYLAQSATAGAYIGYLVEGTTTVANNAAKWKLVKRDEAIASLNEATFISPKNASFLISNANFSRRHDFSSWGADYQTNCNDGLYRTDGNVYLESYHTDFSGAQIITDVPNGLYKFTAQGFYQATGGAPQVAPYIRVNNLKRSLPATSGKEPLPVAASLANGDFALDPIYFEVNDHTISISVVNGTPSNNLWSVWDNFQLEYLKEYPAEPQAGTDLLASMFHSWSSSGKNASVTGNPGCAYVLDVVSDLPYGDASVNYLNYADLSAYTHLEVVARDGEPRFLFNRLVDEGQVADGNLIDITLAANTGYESVRDNGDGTKTYVINLVSIVAKHGFAHLHSIKANWGNNDMQVTSMKLYNGFECYIQNANSGLFLSGANEWGTRATVSNLGDLFLIKYKPGGYTITNTENSSSVGSTLGYNLYTNSDLSQNGDVWTVEAVAGKSGVVAFHGEGFYDSSQDFNHYLSQSAIAGAVSGYIVEKNAGKTAASEWRMLTREEAITKTLTGATSNAPKDATFLIANAHFSVNHSLDKWTMTPVWALNDGGNRQTGGNAGNHDNWCAESYQSVSGFDMYQTISGLPNGLYLLSAQGFYQCSVEQIKEPIIYANNSKKSLHKTTGQATLAGASTEFTAGNFAIDSILVAVSNGTLKIGVKSMDDHAEVNSSLWCVWDNFQLKYLGEIGKVSPYIWRYDFEAAAARDANLEYSDEEVGTFYQATVSNYTRTFYVLEENGNPIEADFGVNAKDPEGFRIYGNGLYAQQRGSREICIANVVKGSYIHIVSSLGDVMYEDKPNPSGIQITQNCKSVQKKTEWSTEDAYRADTYFEVKESGDALFTVNRYTTIYLVEVYGNEPVERVTEAATWTFDKNTSNSGMMRSSNNQTLYWDTDAGIKTTNETVNGLKVNSVADIHFYLPYGNQGGTLQIWFGTHNASSKLSVNKQYHISVDEQDVARERALDIPKGTRLVSITKEENESAITKIVWTPYAAPANPGYDYERTNILAGKLGTICLPYALTETPNYVKFYQVLYKIIDENHRPTSIAFKEVDEFVPGEPYLFISQEDLHLTYVRTGHAAIAQNRNGMYGTYVDYAFYEHSAEYDAEENHLDAQGKNDGAYYMIMSNKFQHAAKENSGVRANRCFLKVSEIPVKEDYLSSNAAPTRQLVITANGFEEQEEESSTAIERLDLDLSNEVSYDLYGRKTTYSENGFYIVGGKIIRK